MKAFSNQNKMSMVGVVRFLTVAAALALSVVSTVEAASTSSSLSKCLPGEIAFRNECVLVEPGYQSDGKTVLRCSHAAMQGAAYCNNHVLSNQTCVAGEYVSETGKCLPVPKGYVNPHFERFDVFYKCPAGFESNKGASKCIHYYDPDDTLATNKGAFLEASTAEHLLACPECPRRLKLRDELEGVFELNDISSCPPGQMIEQYQVCITPVPFGCTCPCYNIYFRCVPAPAPVPVPVPVPQPVAPVPVPVAPVPVPVAPVPVPVAPAPVPVPQPVPVPLAPVPVPVAPVPVPRAPVPVPRPVPVPQPEPEPEPVPRPRPRPAPVSTLIPSLKPSLLPSQTPTTIPSPSPTNQPFTSFPSQQPSLLPSINPSSEPVNQPSSCPISTIPSSQPTLTMKPNQSRHPTQKPTSEPSISISPTVSHKPSSIPTIHPTTRPSQYNARNSGGNIDVSLIETIIVPVVAVVFVALVLVGCYFWRINRHKDQSASLKSWIANSQGEADIQLNCRSNRYDSARELNTGEDDMVPMHDMYGSFNNNNNSSGNNSDDVSTHFATDKKTRNELSTYQSRNNSRTQPSADAIAVVNSSLVQHEF